ncbi:MAG: protein-glutamate methylesterase/protein-glutamine glutaminase [Nanoarchaeota archaeon]
MVAEEKRVLVVDDSALMRRILSDQIRKINGFRVAGLAIDGNDAVQKNKDLRPDLISLDINMPRMDGMEALKKIMKENPTRVVMVSPMVGKQDVVVRCLSLGAIDFVAKPDAPDATFFERYCSTMRAASAATVAAESVARPHARIDHPLRRSSLKKIVTVGSSTGGPQTLEAFLKDIPKGFPSPILIVQHMPPGFTKSLAQRLDGLCAVHVKEAEDGEDVQDGTAYIAPGDYHMELQAEHDKNVIRLHQGPKEESVRPCANVLFRSACRIFGQNTIAIVLTGMGQDGKNGADLIKRSKGTVLAQSEATSIIYGMPKAVVDANLADMVVDIDKMAVALAQLIEV